MSSSGLRRRKMAKILTFPERQLNSASDQRVDGASDLVVFDADGALSFSQTTSNDAEQSLARPEVPLDWTNQELASIYRVKHLLDAAQIPTELDRGVSDEGDPWCVFCTLEGDVFIHLSRIDGLYWLDSSKLATPLNGFSFDELVHGFTKLSEEDKQDAKNTMPKIVAFKKSNTVLLHPSVMLAALVWSLYFEASELLVPGIQKGDAHGAEQDQPNSSSVNLREDIAKSDLNSLSEKAGDKVLLPEVLVQDLYNKVVAGSHLPFSMALGLGSIAVACGLILESDWKGVLRSLLSSDVELDLQSGSSLIDEVPSSVTSALLQSLELIASFVARSGDEETVNEAASGPDRAEIGSIADSVIANLAKLLDSLGDGMGSVSEEHQQRSAKTDFNSIVEGFEEHKVLASSMEPMVEADIAQIYLEDGAQSEALHGLLDFFFSESSLNTIQKDGTVYFLDLSKGEFDLENLEIVEQAIYEAGNNDISVSSTQVSSDALSSTNEPWDAADILPLFDQNARDLISELWDNSNSMSFALNGNSLLLFDLSVYRSNEEQLQMTWATEGGGTVTLLGAKATFEEFGYV